MPDYEIIRSRRRTLALEIKDCRVIVRAPMRLSRTAIDAFVTSHADWIRKHMARAQSRAAAHTEPDEAMRAALIKRARACLPPRVEYYARIMGVRPANSQNNRCAHAVRKLFVKGKHLLFVAADAVPGRGDRLCGRARTGSFKAYEPQRGVLRRDCARDARL